MIIIPTRSLLAVVVLGTVGGCGSFGGPTGLPMPVQQAQVEPVEKSAPTLSTNASGALSAIEATTIVKRFRNRIEGSTSTRSGVTTTTALVSTTSNQPSPMVSDEQVSDEQMEISEDDLKTFLKAYDKDVLRPLFAKPGQPGVDAKVAAILEKSTAGSPPSAIELYRAYLMAYFIGHYVDRGGHKYGAPEVKTGLSNEVLSEILQIFFDAMVDAYSNSPIMVTKGKDNKDNKDKYYPAGNTEKPTLVVLLNNKQVDWNSRRVDVENDPDDGSVAPKGHMTVSKAKAVGAIAEIAQKRSAMASGLIGEAFGGIDLGFVVGGRFSVGDNKTMVELAKRVLAATSYSVAERVAYKYLLDYEYSENDGLGFLLKLISQIEKEQAAKSGAS